MDDRGAPRPRGDGREYDFTKSSERLGLFHRPKPGNEAMSPRSKPTLAEVSVKRPFFYPYLFSIFHYIMRNIKKLCLRMRLHKRECFFEYHRTTIPYSGKVWRALNFANWLSVVIGKF